MRPIFLAIFVGGCAGNPAPAPIVAQSAPAPQTSPIGDAAKNAVDAFYICVRTSARAQLQTTADRAQAAEMAFLSCQTEEQRLRAVGTLGRVRPEFIEAIIIKHKTALKAEIVGS
jgi:hypothetical protein